MLLELGVNKIDVYDETMCDNDYVSRDLSFTSRLPLEVHV